MIILTNKNIYISGYITVVPLKLCSLLISIVSFYSVINHMAYIIGGSVQKRILNVCLFFKKALRIILLELYQNKHVNTFVKTYHGLHYNLFILEKA